MKTATVLLLLFGVALGGSNSVQRSAASVKTREVRELRMAEQAILGCIAFRTTAEDRCCQGGGYAELGLALIGARRSPMSLKALARVMRYSLDGALSEDYPCYVLQKGAAIKPYLRALDPAELNQQCRSELQDLSEGSSERLDPTTVCSDPDFMKKQISELLKGIDKGTKCSAGDF